jgi:hypothetical protein
MRRPLPALLFCALMVALPRAPHAQEVVVLTTDTATEAADVTAQTTETEAEALSEPETEGGLRILDAAEVALDTFRWQARIVAVLADTPNDPAFVQQMREIEARAADLAERDVVVLTDTDPRGRSDLRQTLRARGFMLAIIEKDGTIAQRRPAPRDVREIAAIIDRFPLRRQEMLERRPAGR